MGFLSSISSAVRSVAQSVTTVAQQVTKAVQQPPEQLGHSLQNQFVGGPAAKPPAATQKLDFVGDPAARKALIENASQVNSISNDMGNAQAICGGASIANALVLSAKTPEAAKQNAQALRETARRIGMPPSKEQEAALKAMESGKMSPTDLQHLQQLSHNVVKATDLGKGPTNSDLATPGEMGFAVTMLRANGAFQQEPNVSFNLARTTAAGGNHWTTTVGNQHADSQTTPTGGAALTSNGTPPGMQMDGANPGWRGEVNVHNGTPPKVDVAYLEPNSNPPQARFVELNDPAQFNMRDMNDMTKIGAVIRRLNEGTLVRIGTTTVDRPRGAVTP